MPAVDGNKRLLKDGSKMVSRRLLSNTSVDNLLVPSVKEDLFLSLKNLNANILQPKSSLLEFVDLNLTSMDLMRKSILFMSARLLRLSLTLSLRAVSTDRRVHESTPWVYDLNNHYMYLHSN